MTKDSMTKDSMTKDQSLRELKTMAFDALYSTTEKYFKKPGCLRIFLRVVFIFVVISVAMGCFEQNNVFMKFLGIAFVIAIICNYLIRKKVSDAEYDKAVQSVLEFLKEQALEKLGVDEDEVSEIEPILFGGYDYSNYTLSKQGEDGIWRTNKYEVVYLFFSQNEVHCYTLEFSTSESKSIESTDVYFYKDVVSVSTCSKSVKIEGYEYEYEMFKLVTAGGTVLEVSLKDVENSRNSINAMRQLLREKKAK